MYFLAGSISAPVILLLLTLFPSINSLHLFPESTMVKMLMLSFIQVALLEEGSKYALYKIFRNSIKPKLNQHPLAIMIYAGSVSLGFAFTENILYGFRVGIEVLYWRAMTSVIMHMACGMMMGYWISLSIHKFKLKTNPTNDTMGVSIMDVILKKKPSFRRVFYTIMGILMAVFFHGLYDFNIFGVYNFDHSYVEEHLSMSIQIIIIFFSLYLVKEMANHLVKLNIKK